MQSISLKLPANLHAKLAELARRRNVPKSSIVRAALEGYLDGKRKDRGPSCAELAGDLAGSVEGPADLATHPKHMTGYGR